MSEVTFTGFAEFSDTTLPSVFWLVWRLPNPYRMVLTDSTIRIEGRWSLLRRWFPSRACGVRDVRSAKLRGTLILLTLDDDRWWSFSSMMRCETILRELESRGVTTSRDR